MEKDVLERIRSLEDRVAFLEREAKRPNINEYNKRHAFLKEREALFEKPDPFPVKIPEHKTWARDFAKAPRLSWKQPGDNQPIIRHNPSSVFFSDETASKPLYPVTEPNMHRYYPDSMEFE